MEQKRILVVEDNPLNMELVVDLLDTKKYLISKVATAEKAIQQAQEFSPDLILMDLRLPGMDGLTATKILKKNTKTRNVAVIALTAHAMESDRHSAIAAGCDGYITKPIDTVTFLDEIAEFLKHRETR